MFNNKLVILASAILANQAIATNAHRHLHRDVHVHEKKDLHYAATETVTQVDWVTVTVDPSDQAQTASAAMFKAQHAHQHPSSEQSTQVQVTTSSSTPAAAATSEVVPPPPPAPATTDVVAPPAPDIIASPQPATTQGGASVSVGVGVGAGVGAGATGSSSGTSGGGKAGLAYNDHTLLAAFRGSKRIGWAYNWGQVSDGTPDEFDTLEYVPMLWSNREDFLSTWDTNAKNAIASGAKNMLAFNEPDFPLQANMGVSQAVQAWKDHMQQFAGQVRLGTPAITSNVAPNTGREWLTAWIKECNGQCSYDFCACHWYGQPNQISDLYQYLLDVHDICGKPVWLTEMGDINSDPTQKANFLKDFTDTMENNATFSFVERYAYFMTANGNTNNGQSLTPIGKLYAAL